MNLYEHTLIVRQDISPSQLKQIQEKYTKLVEEFDGNIVKTENLGFSSIAFFEYSKASSSFLRDFKTTPKLL